jgi:hypothetical protein
MRAVQPARADRRAQAETFASPVADQQRAVGNQAVQRLIESRAVQPKLTVAPPDDAYEQEADRVANEVVGKPGTAGSTPTSESSGAVHRLNDAVHRAPAKAEDEKKKPEGGDKGGKGQAQKEPPKGDAKGGGKEKDAKGGGKEKKEEPKKKEEDKVKRKAAILDDEEKEEKEDESMQRLAADEAVPDVTPELEHQLDRLAAGGQPLPDELRTSLEPRFGRDLSDVRVHLDSEAAAAARELQAQAFTRGEHVFFGAGNFEPHSAEGRWLLAHELTHTLQQKASAREDKGKASSGALLRRVREDDEEFDIPVDIDQEQE